MGQENPGATTLVAFGATVLIGGTNFVAVRFSNFELPPFWGASSRFALAALIFFALVLALRRRLPQGRALVGALLYGILGFGTSYAFVYYGLVHVPAGLASVILSLVPLATFFVAWGHGLETFRWRGLAGALLAVAGIAIAYREQLDAAVPWTALLALLGGVVSIAESIVLVKRFPKIDPLAMNAIGMATGTILLYALSVATHEVHVIPVEQATLLAFGYLVVVGSGGLFFLYLFVLRRWTASATSYQFVLTPVVAILLGHWLADEAITFALLLGGLLVVAGVWVGALHIATGRPSRA